MRERSQIETFFFWLGSLFTTTDRDNAWVTADTAPNHLEINKHQQTYLTEATLETVMNLNSLKTFVYN